MKYTLKTEQEILDQFDTNQITEEQMDAKEQEFIEKYNREIVKVEMIFEPGHLAAETNIVEMVGVAELIVTLKGE